eukprot:Pompholyxophrys_sp_v1_NODE_13_length_4899_cov_11.419162.p3 type:complete len:123 gc:universal NODE_13_length_4899_cov_11.419162:4146-4514(+)
MNIHCLRHLCDCVFIKGPLWAYSCLPSENVNGMLKKNVHGTYQFHTALINNSIAHYHLSRVCSHMKLSPGGWDYLKHLNVFDIDAQSVDDIQTSGLVATIPTPAWCADALLDMPGMYKKLIE